MRHKRSSAKGVPATPVLDWDPVPEAAFYMIYLANDRELTNRVFGSYIPVTTNTRWTLTSEMPKEALADNQAGQSYYWFVRPCKATGKCGPDPVSTHTAATNGFRKLSPAVTGLKPGVALGSPATPPSLANDITFDWHDYHDTNQLAPPYPGGARTVTPDRADLPHRDLPVVDVRDAR